MIVKTPPDNFTADPRQLVHCRYCFEPLYIVYSSAKRDICYECLEEIKMENAKEIMKGRI